VILSMEQNQIQKVLRIQKNQTRVRILTLCDDR